MKKSSANIEPPALAPWRTARRARYRLRRSVALAVSIGLHALIASLELGELVLGLPGFALPLAERRVQAPDLTVRLVEAPRPPVVEPPRPAAPPRADKSFDFVTPAPPRKPRPLAQPRRESADPVPAAEAPARKPAIQPEPRPDVLALDEPRPETFSVPPPVPTESEPLHAPEIVAQARDEEETRRKAEEAQKLALDADRLREEAARQQAEEARRKAEGERRKEDEARRLAQEADRLKEEEAQRITQEIERRKDEEAQKLALEAEKLKEEAVRQQAEEARRKAEEETRRKAEVERRKDEEARRLVQEIEKRKEEEARRLAQEAERLKEEEARRLAQEAAAERKRAEAQAAAERERLAAEQAHAAAAAASAAAGASPAPGALSGRELAAKALGQLRAPGAIPLDPPRPPPPPADTSRRRAILEVERDVVLRMYAESWRAKIERNGPLNFRGSAGLRAPDYPVVTVAIRSDGSVEHVHIHRSSGLRELDDAVRRIVDFYAPYSRFPPAIASRFDVIEIRRVWQFDGGLRLVEETR